MSPITHLVYNLSGDCSIKGVITLNLPVVWPEITLPTRGLKSVTLPTRGMFRLFSVIHLC